MPDDTPVLLEITCNNVRMQMSTIPKSRLNELYDFVVKANKESDTQSTKES